MSFISFDSLKVLFLCGVSFIHDNYKIFHFSLQALQIYLPIFLSLDTVFSVVFIKESIEKNEHTIAILGFAVFSKSICWCSIIFFFSSAMYMTHAYVSSIQ